MTPPETPTTTTTTTFWYLVLTIVPKKCNPGSERENGLGRKRQKMDWGVGQACCCCWWSWWVSSVNHPVKLFGWLRSSLHHYKRQNKRREREREVSGFLQLTDKVPTRNRSEWLASNNTCELQMGDTRAWKYPNKEIGCCELQMRDTRTWKYPMKGIGCCELQMGDTRAWKYPNKEIGCCMEHLLQQSEKGRLGGDHSCFKIWRLPACLPPGPPPVLLLLLLLWLASLFSSLLHPVSPV